MGRVTVLVAFKFAITLSYDLAVFAVRVPYIGNVSAAVAIAFYFG